MPGEIKIREDFKKHLVPLRQEELDALRESVVAEGIRDPLVVWAGRNVLLDGHNRYRLAEENDLEFDVVEVDLEDEDDAIEWIENNQLGRRNLTKDQFAWLIGQKYIRQKQSHGGERASAQNEHLKTAERLAEEHGVGHATVRRAANYAQAVDAIGETNPALRDQILTDGKLTHGEVAEVSLLPADEIVKLASTEEAKKRVHVSHNSGENEWYTPPQFIEIARQVMGAIDLDPASSDVAQQNVQAAAYYTKDDDGLSVPWAGRLWMNPPYEKGLIDRFVDKLAEHVEAGDVSEFVVLVNNATDTRWFRRLLDVTSAVTFPTGRVRFLKVDGEKGAPLQGQALVYGGPNTDAFAEATDGVVGACLLSWRLTEAA